MHWSDASSPKGVKVKKSLVDLSDYLIVVYIANNFMIRELCFLDSSFVPRKFSGKGHENHICKECSSKPKGEIEEIEYTVEISKFLSQSNISKKNISKSLF